MTATPEGMESGTDSGTESGKRKASRILPLIALILAACSIAFFIYLGSKGGSPKVQWNPIIGEQQQNEPPAPPVQNQEDEYNRIKKEVATGVLKEVPEGINVSKHLVIMEYLYDCSQITEIGSRLPCFEDHYFSVDNTLKEQKETCSNKPSPEKENCLDQFNFAMANEWNDDFCEAIIEKDLREKCLTSIQ